VCGLALCCIGLAGLYYFLHSPFLALMEILIYVGAVCVTIMFAVMLAEPDEPANNEKPAGVVIWGGIALAAAGGILWGLTRLGTGADWPAPEVLPQSGSIKAIGISLLTTYSLAFELISLVLVVAVIGALALARPGRKATPNP
jgi:NADH-quinone oxidoreductase subunit J